MKGRNPVAEIVPCPNCARPVSVAAGQVTLVCGHCGATLEVEPADAPPGPAPAPARAIPLPFGRPASAPPPARRASTGPVKAQLAPEAPPERRPAPTPARPGGGGKASSPYDITGSHDEGAERERRRREVAEEVVRLDREDIKSAAREKRVGAECEQARQGNLAFKVACYAQAVTVVLAAAFMMNVGALAPGTAQPLLLVIVLGYAVHFAGLFAAFGLYLQGPRPTRGAAALGLLLTGGHAALMLAVGAAVGERLTPREVFDRSWVSDQYELELPLSSAVCNLYGGTDLVVYPQLFTAPSAILLVPLALAAMLEFAKVSALGVMANQLGVLGKDHDLAAAGLRFVYRVLTGLIVFGLAKGVLAATSVLYDGWGFFTVFGWTAGLHLWWAFCWGAQAQVFDDLNQVLTPTRVLDRRERIE